MLSHSAHRAVTGPEVVAAGVILRRSEGGKDRWLLLKARKNREWGFPKGHQDPGESHLQTAIRETAEETGIALIAVEGEPMELHYRLPDGRAKKVVYFPARTSTEDVCLSDEHSDFEWMSAKEIEDHLPHAGLRSLFKAYLARRSRTTTSWR